MTEPWGAGVRMELNALHLLGTPSGHTTSQKAAGTWLTPPVPCTPSAP